MLFITTKHTKIHMLCFVFGGSCYKYNFCHDKTYLLLRQTFVVANICRDKPNYVTTNLFHSKLTFVGTNMCLSKVCLSQQKFYCGKHTFVMTKDVLLCLSRPKWYLWQLPPMTVFCPNKWRFDCSCACRCSGVCDSPRSSAGWPDWRSSRCHGRLAEETPASRCQLHSQKAGPGQVNM